MFGEDLKSTCSARLRWREIVRDTFIPRMLISRSISTPYCNRCQLAFTQGNGKTSRREHTIIQGIINQNMARVFPERETQGPETAVGRSLSQC